MATMFSWPNTTESRGMITLSAWHWSPGSERVAHVFAWIAGILAPVLFLIVFHGDGAENFFLGMLGIFLGMAVGVISKPIFSLLCRTTTTVRISADQVEVAGIPYGRAAALIQFTNLYPRSITLDKTDGRHSMTLGSLEETASLRMFYGSNAVVITTFKSVEKAGRFALACNAACDRLVMPASRGVVRVSVSQLYQSGYVESLPGQSRPVLGTNVNLPTRRR